MFNSFFQGTVFLYLTNLVTAIYPLIDTVFISEQHFQPWDAYSQCIWQIFQFKVCYNFKEALTVLHLSGTVVISGDHLQWSSIFKGTDFLLNKHL